MPQLDNEPRPTATAAKGGTRSAKVPEVTASFWLIKLLTTGMGETTSDTLVHTVDPVLAVIGVGVVFTAALAIQFSSDRYDRWRYWTAVTMVSVFGTMAADVVHIVLGVPYLASTLAFISALIVIFAAWNASEGTLSIHSIYTRRREAFYWLTVMATFALGTAAGDMTATTLGLGYLDSGILFAGVFVLPALWYFFTGRNPILTFWTAYVLTRPVGASFSDWMGVSHERGGLAWGTAPVSIALLLAIIVLVAVSSRTAAPKLSPANDPATAAEL